MLPTATIDIGTTSVKLCVFDAGGEPVVETRHPTPAMPDQWGEIYDIAKLKMIVLDFLRGLDSNVRSSVERITVAGIGSSGGLVQPDLTLVSPMILWHDHRGADYLAKLGEAERRLVYQVTGIPVNANYGLSKAAWAVATAGDAAAGAQWLNVIEYLAAWMTGRRWSERSLASRTMALDLAGGTWSAEICALLGLDVAVFPELRAASEGSPIAAGFAREAALDDRVVVHVAGHDHMVGGVGAGLRVGELLNSTGTTEGVLVLRETPALDDHAEQSKLANGLACEGSDFTLFASIPTGGSAFATLQAMLGVDAERLSACIGDLYARYMSGDIDLARIPLVLPQFRGSPPPTKHAWARGVVAGVASDTSPADIVFGCFLGMALEFRDVMDLFRTPVGAMKVIGPASRNDLWLQLKADVLRTPLSVSNSGEVVSRGAQALASSTSVAWESCRPRDVFVNDRGADALSQWYRKNAARWEYLKDVPR